MPSTPDTQQQATQGEEFLAFLATTNKGRTAVELTERLHELVEAIRETGKGGSLTYRVTVKPVDNGDGAVTVTDEITVKVPRLERPKSIFFVDDESNLVRHNPRQTSLFAD